MEPRRRQVFSVDLLERHAAKGHGVITCMTAANDAIVLGTSKGWLIRHDFAGGGVNSFLQIDLSAGRPGEQSIHKLFLDPAAGTCIATLIGAATKDTFFFPHANWANKKPRILAKLKGLVANAVAWKKSTSDQIILLGMDNGQLHQVVAHDKVKFLFQLPEAFTGLHMETRAGNNGTSRYYVMAVTPTRLYTFTGNGSSLDSVFAQRALRFIELPGEIPNSELRFFVKRKRATHFAWLSGAGIYHGGLHFRDDKFFENRALLEYSKLGESVEVVKPTSLLVSEFHFLVLVGNKIKVVNRISEQIVEELHLHDAVSRGGLGLCSDTTNAGLFYAFDESSIFQVSANDEGRDMWRVYLELKEYAAALANCRDALQRDRVYIVQAESAFTDKDFLRAASFYAKINFAPSFEEIALKFISTGGQEDALRTFLLRSLDKFSQNDDKCQIAMVSTWATQLYLAKINRLLLDDDAVSSEFLSEFRAFLIDSKDVLDEATTMKLLESYGRIDELIFFASLKEQHEIVVHHYIQLGEAKKALRVLEKPDVPTELQYKFAPDLIMLDAYETVESWMATKDLDPRKLIPAIMRYLSKHDHEVIIVKYLEYCVHRLRNEDRGVHNLLLSLYAKQEDESPLLRFLQCKFGNGPEFFFDPKYALLHCLKQKRMRACIHIYSMMSMHEEAVALALHVDPDLAKAGADKVKDDEGLRKKLWLMVAKHVIGQEKGTKRDNVRKDIALLKETGGLVKIEDILPFFPDFAMIDDFKEAICSSLEGYNERIEKLKREMSDATQCADRIRNDISALAQRFVVIKREEECVVCRREIVGSMAPFYVFPCGHSFHFCCLIAHVTLCTSEAQAEYILDLQKQLILMEGNEPSKEKIRSQLDDAVASECPFCGDLMVREISLPFILPEETGEIESWEIKPHNLGTQNSISMTA